MEGSGVATSMVKYIVEDITLVFNSAIGWVSDVAETIVAQPLLLLFCVIPVVGLGVGLFRRLINVN